MSDNLEYVLSFASHLTTQVSKNELIRRVAILERGTSHKDASASELAAIDYKKSGSAQHLIALFMALENNPGARTYRPEILRVCINALRSAAPNEPDAFLAATVRIREQTRMLGRRVPPRAVGSPLLFKGLEADVAVILDASDFDNVPKRNMKNLYVAITRGSRKLVVCSASPLVG